MFRARGPAPGRSDAGAARRRHDAALDGAQPGRLPEGHRDHARRRSACGPGQGGGGRGGPRRRRAGGGRRRRFGEDEYYLAFLGTPSTTAPWMLQFGGHHLAINLTLAGSQATHGAEPARRAAGDLHVRGPDGPSAGQRERQGVRADQRARRRPAQAGDPQLPRRRSRARAGPGRTHDPARGHSRVGALARRSRRCCWISCASGPAS